MDAAIRSPANIPKMAPSPPMSMTMIATATLKRAWYFLAVELGMTDDGSSHLANYNGFAVTVSGRATTRVAVDNTTVVGGTSRELATRRTDKLSWCDFATSNKTAENRNESHERKRNWRVCKLRTAT